MELKILFGPTATSKTKIAQALWEKTHYPILSVDSRKVYKGADIGTNKLSLLTFWKAHPEVLIGGIDFLEPSQEVSVYIYQQQVYNWLTTNRTEIEKAGGIILHGGTGLYLDAILEGKSLLSSRNQILREELAGMTVEQLQQRAGQEVPKSYGLLNDSDRRNPRRLVRVIENKALKHQSTKALRQESINALKHEGFAVEVFKSAKKDWRVNIPPRAELYGIINKRVYTYLEEGWLAEVANLLKRFGPEAPVLRMMGYRKVVAFMQNNEHWQQLAVDNAPKFQAMIAEIQQEHRRYAKRQETWAKKYRQP